MASRFTTGGFCCAAATAEKSETKQANWLRLIHRYTLSPPFLKKLEIWSEKLQIRQKVEYIPFCPAGSISSTGDNRKHLRFLKKENENCGTTSAMKNGMARLGSHGPAIGKELLPAAQDTIAQDVVTLSDVELLARAAGPCITAVLSIPNPLEIEVRFKNAIRSIENKLKEIGSEAEAPELMRPIRELRAAVEGARIWAQSIALFRSPDLFLCFLLSEPAKETITAEQRFQVRPLLSALAREQRFSLLALSRRNVRLFHCTQHHTQEESLQGLAPQDIRVWMGTWKPDHVLDNRAVAGPASGSMKGVTFTTSRDREREHEYLAHFFTEVDRGIHALVRREGAPLVLAGVEEEVAIYRRVNTYPRLLERAVNGSPATLEVPVLHGLAREIVGGGPSEPLAKTFARFERYRDSARVSSDAHQILPAAAEGRVADLVFSRNAELRGCTVGTGQIETRDDGEDLLNATALWTILHGGQAFALPEREMPIPGEVAAVFRF